MNTTKRNRLFTMAAAAALFSASPLLAQIVFTTSCPNVDYAVNDSGF